MQVLSAPLRALLFCFDFIFGKVSKVRTRLPLFLLFAFLFCSLPQAISAEFVIAPYQSWSLWGNVPSDDFLSASEMCDAKAAYINTTYPKFTTMYYQVDRYIESFDEGRCVNPEEPTGGVLAGRALYCPKNWDAGNWRNSPHSVYWRANDGYCSRPLNKIDVDKGKARVCQTTPRPINIATGNKYLVEKDYVGNGPFPLQLTRTYNSTFPTWLAIGTGYRPTPNALGDYWQTEYHQHIFLQSTIGYSTARIWRGDGKAYFFNLSGSAWVPEADVTDRLEQLIDGSGNPTGWRYTTSNDEVELYDVNGNLLSITNRAGHTQTLTYSDGTTGPNGGYVLDANGNPTAVGLPAGLMIRVSDASGHSLQFGYDSKRRMVKATTPDSGAILYTFDSLDNLTTVIYPDATPSDINDNPRRTYIYNETTNTSSQNFPHAITGVVDENNAVGAGSNLTRDTGLKLTRR